MTEVTASFARGATTPIPTLPPAVVTSVLAGVPWFKTTPGPFTGKPPLNEEVAVVLVALKYGAPILPHASIPPAKEEVAVDLIQIGMVVVGVSALMPKVSVCCCQS